MASVEMPTAVSAMNLPAADSARKSDNGHRGSDYELVPHILGREAVGMRSYGQYCPIARASELLAERWSVIVLRNIVILGCRTFNEIADCAPGLCSAPPCAAVRAKDTTVSTTCSTTYPRKAGHP
jgi:hypothetical protein